MDTNAVAGLNASLETRYTIERELGRGGMATVYLAADSKHRRNVAIKVLHPELSAMLGVERFLQEIELTASLQHPNILPLFDSGSADGLLYYVMPFVEGETLRARLARENQLPVADALRVATDVAGALEYAHRRGIIHRDIKPENILLQDGRPLVADFGIALAVQQAGGARMTHTGISLGTPQYMAPEQAMGERNVDARADIYALGAVLYEMLTGEPPFTGPTAQAVVAKVVASDATPIASLRKSVPLAVAAAVHTALEKLPADRFSAVADFARALQGDSAGPDSRARAAPRGRVRMAVAGIAIFAIGALAASAVLPHFGAEPAGEERIRLTFTGDASQPIPAPDGRSFSYVRSPCVSGDCPSSLVVQGLPSGEPAVVLSGMSQLTNFGWSFDGSLLLFGGTPSGGRPGVYVATRAAAVRRIYNGAVNWAAFKDSKVVTLNVLPNRPLLLVSSASGDVIDSLRIGGGGWAPLGVIGWTRDGFLVFTAQHDRAILGGVADAHGVVIDTIRATSPQSGLTVSTVDGGVLEQGADNHARFKYLRHAIDGRGHLSRTTQALHESDDESIALTPDGYLAGLRNATSDLWFFDFHGHVERLTHTTAWYLGYSVAPDNRSVVVLKQDALGANAYLLSPGGKERALTADSGIRSILSWLPDGRRFSIAVADMHSSAFFRTDIVDIESGRSHVSSLPQSNAYTFWLSRGRVLGVPFDGSSPVVLDTTGRKISALTTADSLPNSASAALLPDTSAFLGLVGNPERVVVRAPVDGSPFTTVARVPEPDSVTLKIANISADGKMLYFTKAVAPGKTEIWRMTTDGKSWSRYAVVPVPCNVGPLWGLLVLANDLQHGACMVTDARPDIWMVRTARAPARGNRR